MEKITNIYQTYINWLWSANSSKNNKISSFSKNILQILSAVIGDLKEGQLSLRAMSLVYTTLISIVPLFAISFSVLKGLGAHNQIKPFLLNALEPLGEKGVEITNKLISFIDNIQVGVLGAAGIIILLYTVIGMLQKIENSFNFVWHIKKSRDLGKRFNDYVSILLFAPFMVFLSSALTASAKSNYIIEKIGNVPALDLILTLVGVIIPYIILAFAFSFLYKFMPNTKVKWHAALASGLVTAFIWKIMGWGFANFVANSANHTAIYSAFATIGCPCTNGAILIKGNRYSPTHTVQCSYLLHGF